MASRNARMLRARRRRRGFGNYRAYGHIQSCFAEQSTRLSNAYRALRQRLAHALVAQ